MPETSDMQRPRQTRALKHGVTTMLVVCMLLPAPTLLHAQMTGRQRASTLPATPPTAPQPIPAPAPITPPPPTPAQSLPSRAHVIYTNGLPSISPANSSLNHILSEISR